MSSWYESPEAVKWLNERMTLEDYRDIETIFHDEKKLENAIHLILTKEHFLRWGKEYEQNFTKTKESLLKSHEAVLFLVYKRYWQKEVKNCNSASMSLLIPKLRLSQQNTAKYKKNEVIYFLEDFIYFLQQKPTLWWFKCPSFSFALSSFKQEAHHG